MTSVTESRHVSERIGSKVNGRRNVIDRVGHDRQTEECRETVKHDYEA